MTRSFKRSPADLRPVTLTPDVSRHAEGSCLVEFGHTKVLCTASIEESIPPYLRGKGQGWVTAEYGMLPRSTNTRNPREAAKGSSPAARRRSSASSAEVCALRWTLRSSASGRSSSTAT